MRLANQRHKETVADELGKLSELVEVEVADSHILGVGLASF